MAGLSAPASLPSAGNVPWSSNAWVRCQARNATTQSSTAVLQWGAAGPVGSGPLMQVASLDVGFLPTLAPLPNSGTVSTFAGSGSAAFADGAGLAAAFSFPSGLVVDQDGVTFVVDGDNDLIRRVSPDGLVTTIAGSTRGFADVQGSASQFSFPVCVAIAPSTSALVVTDESNNRVRLVTPSWLVTTLAGGAL